MARVLTMLLMMGVPALGLHVPAKVTYRIDEQSSHIAPASRHPKLPKKQAPPSDSRTLSAFMESLSHDGLARSLESRLPPGMLNVQALAPNGGAGKLGVGSGEGEDARAVLLTPEPIYLGPRALNLWLRPQLVVWLRSKGRKVEAEAHICGSGGSSACGWLSIAQLHLKTLCMWVEESLKHLEGDVVPCLMLRSDLHLDLTVPDRLPWWLRLIPEALLLSLWRRSVSAALERMQANFARALIGEYEDWRLASA